MSAYPWRNSRDASDGNSSRTIPPAGSCGSSEAALVSPAPSRNFPLPNHSRPVNSCATNTKSKVSGKPNDDDGDAARESPDVVELEANDETKDVITTNVSSRSVAVTNINNTINASSILNTPIIINNTTAANTSTTAAIGEVSVDTCHKNSIKRNTNDKKDCNHENIAKSIDIYNDNTNNESSNWSDCGTLGSTYSSGSSGYGSLTRFSKLSNSNNGSNVYSMVTNNDTKVTACTTLCTNKQQVNTKSSNHLNVHNQTSNNNYALVSSSSTSNIGSDKDMLTVPTSLRSSSPSFFMSVYEATAEIFSKTLKPDPDATPKSSSTSNVVHSPSDPNLSQISKSNPDPNSNTGTSFSTSSLRANLSRPIGGRHKDAILHHILPCRFYPSPRPLRRGSSAESINYSSVSKPTSCQSAPSLPLKNSNPGEEAISSDSLKTNPSLPVVEVGVFFNPSQHQLIFFFFSRSFLCYENLVKDLIF